MNTESFVQNMAVILVAVGFVSVLFGRLGWPRAIGYILAGVFLGRYTFGGSMITGDVADTVNVLGQMGVMFLMFTLGLEFSIRKLKSVAGVAPPVAALDALLMIWAGHFIGRHVFGWGTLPSLFLGAAICDSATTVLAKTISDLGWSARRFTGYVMGITMSEDILCVAIIAVISGLALRAGTAMDVSLIAHSLGGLSVFMVSVVVFGFLLVPRLLNWVGRQRDDESLLLSTLGACFLVVFVSIKLQYGVEIGAFLVGLVVAGSNMLKRIYKQSTSLRSMFSAIFFVTIGLMIDPSQLWLYRWQILLVSMVIVVGKTLNCAVGCLVTGLDMKSAIQTGMGLAQIGEFALIVAFLGLELKVFPDNGMFYPVVVGASLVTTILNAGLIRLSEPVSNWAVRRMPKRWRIALENYAGWVARFGAADRSSEAWSMVRRNFVLGAVALALVAAIFIMAGSLVGRFPIFALLPGALAAYEPTILWCASLLFTLPLSFYLLYIARSLGASLARILIPETATGSNWASAFGRIVSYVVMGVALWMLYLEHSLFASTLMPRGARPRLIIFGLILLVGVFGFSRLRKIIRESVATLRAAMSKDEAAGDPLDIHTGIAMAARRSSMVGRSLREGNLRGLTGAMVVGIERDGESIVNPGPEERILVGDRVLLLGADAQIDKARHILAGLEK